MIKLYCNSLTVFPYSDWAMKRVDNDFMTTWHRTHNTHRFHFNSFLDKTICFEDLDSTSYDTHHFINEIKRYKILVGNRC